MNCRTFRELAYERIVDLEGGVSSLEPAAADGAALEHSAGCSRCARHWRDLLIQVRLLTDLEPLPVPADLEGRVVAALQPGHRQDRAVSHLAALPRLEAPPVLARRLESEFSRKAPAALRLRLEKAFEEPDAIRRGDEGRARRFLRSPRTGAMAAAALLVLTVWVIGPGGEPDPSAPAGEVASGYSFKIVRVDSLRDASLDPTTRAWIDGFTGGMLGSAD